MLGLRLAALGAVLFLLVPGLEAQSSDVLDREFTPRSGVPCPAPGSDSLTRPGVSGSPTDVALGLFFQDIAQLNDVDQTLDADVYVLARWLDPRLADPARGTDSAECPALEGKIWMPAVEPENLRSRQSFYATRLLVDPQGVVTWARRLWVKISYPLDFRDFPFDRHRWSVTLWPVLSRSDELVFRPLKRAVGANDHLSIQGWRVGAPTAEATTSARIARSGSFAKFDVRFELTRDWRYYAWKLGIPLLLIVLMAYGVYFVPGSMVVQQIGLGMTSMLTLIAYMLALSGSLPRISYLTRADWFFVGAAVLVFMGLVKAVATSALGRGQDTPTTVRLNWWGRWLYPVGILLTLLLALGH